MSDTSSGGNVELKQRRQIHVGDEQDSVKDKQKLKQSQPNVKKGLTLKKLLVHPFTLLSMLFRGVTIIVFSVVSMPLLWLLLPLRLFNPLFRLLGWNNGRLPIVSE